MHNSLDLPAHLHFDTMVRYVDQLKDRSVPAYVALDLRLAWKPSNTLELAIVGQNLLDDRHPELVSTSVTVQRAEIQRGVYLKMTLQF